MRHIFTPFTLIIPDMHCGQQSAQSDHGQNPSLKKVLLQEMTEAVERGLTLLTTPGRLTQCHAIIQIILSLLVLAETGSAGN